MFNKILAALDHSETSHSLFEKALELAKQSGSKLMLLHVLSVEEEGSPGLPVYASLDYQAISNEDIEAYRRRWDAFQQEIFERLKAYSEQAIALGVQTEFTQTSGSPGRMICDLAKTWQADLVVLGRRGRSRLGELILGSVSNYVMHRAPCSVLILQHLKPEAT